MDDNDSQKKLKANKGLEPDYRKALGTFATGVTVVTVMGEDGLPHGMTVNSFSSVSLDPPLVLWSLAEDTLGFIRFQQAKHFCINVLASDQTELALNFAQQAKNKFAGIAHDQGWQNIPHLKNCIAYFDCALEAQHAGGDHTIIVGRVHEFSYHDNREPLLFFGGEFQKL